MFMYPVHMVNIIVIKIILWRKQTQNRTYQNIKSPYFNNKSTTLTYYRVNYRKKFKINKIFRILLLVT